MADKKEVKGLVKKILNKVTPNTARIFSILVTIIVLVLFLATSTGRNVITFLAYVLFVACTLYGGYKLYKYTTENAHGTPKEKPAKEEPKDDYEYVVDPFGPPETSDLREEAPIEEATSEDATSEDVPVEKEE